MVEKTSRNSDDQSQYQVWKEELDALKSQKSNKSLHPAVLRSVIKEINVLEERLSKWNEMSAKYRKVQEDIKDLSDKLSELRKELRSHESFLGIVPDKSSGRKSKFNPVDVSKVIENNGGSATYAVIAKTLKINQATIKKNVEETYSTTFKVDKTVRPRTVSVK